MLVAEGKALDKLLSNNQFPVISSKDQDHKKALYFGKRDPSDGIIDWEKDENAFNDGDVCIISFTAVELKIDDSSPYISKLKIKTILKVENTTIISF